MKIHDLRIRNVRGIRTLDLSFGGASAVVFGPNGTGKSTVVDAIDFLLTGDIQRLTGRRGVSLREHGQHLVARGQEAWVEATVEVPGHTGLVTLRRSFNAPTQLQCPAAALPLVTAVVVAAEQRQYMLTRSGVLTFITAAPRTRAEMVQTLLNLDRVESIRQAIVRAANTATSALREHRASRIAAEGQLATSLGLTTFTSATALEAVNRHRAILGGAAVAAIAESKADLIPPQRDGSVEGSPSPLTDIELVGRTVKPDQQTTLDALDEQLRRHLASLRASAEDLKAAERIEFFERAVLAVEGLTECPICDTSWPEGHLHSTVQAKLTRARVLIGPLNQVRESADAIVRWIGGHIEAVARLIVLAPGVLPEETVGLLTTYGALLQDARREYSDPLRLHALGDGMSQRMSERLGLDALYENLREVYRAVSAQTRADPRQLAWDALTRAEENRLTVQRCAVEESSSRALAEQAESLRGAFIDARDSVLTEIYDSVRDRFVDLYKQIHAPDEATFAADIRPTDAGLDIEVDFYGVTRAAPFALHSEGHQDSMGLCLFLALAERADAGGLGIRVLDDVVMSVDAGHRKGVARLLAHLGLQVQFIITTHDQVWAKQLQGEGCVRSRNATRLLNWTVNSGPIARSDADFLESAELSLMNHDVPEAAAALRRGLEEFFQCSADGLGAKVRFSLAGQYDLGQVSQACFSRLKELTKKARLAARSWNRTTEVQTFESIETEQSAALAASNAEQWAINANVHFNQWANMTEAEFRPVLDAFKRVCRLFTCSGCKGRAAVISAGPVDVAVKCPCGSINWSLTDQG